MAKRLPDAKVVVHKPKWPYLLLFGLILVFFWDSIFAHKVFCMRDVFCGILNWPPYARRALHTDEFFLLWNPFWGFGKPYIADPVIEFFYPFNWIYGLFSPACGVTTYCAFHLLVTGASIYALARHWKMDIYPALLSAVSMMFSSWVIAVMEFNTLFPTFVWGPLELLVVSHMVETWRGSAFGGLWAKAGHVALMTGIISLQFLAGYPQILVYTQLLIASFAFARAYSLGKPRMIAGLFCTFAVAGFLALCLDMVQFLPSWEFIQLSERSVAVDPGLEQASVHPRHLLTLLLPFLYGRPGYPREYWGQTLYEFWAGTCYVGILPLIMLTFSPLVLSKLPGKRAPGDLRRFLFLFFAGVAVVGLVLSAGKYTPFYMLLYQVIPGFSHFRWPSKFLVLVLYSLSILAGLGFQLLLEQKLTLIKSRGGRSIVTFWAALLLLAIIGFIIGAQNSSMFGWLTGGLFLSSPTHDQSAVRDCLSAVIFTVAGLAALALLVSPRVNPSVGGPVVIAVAFLNLWIVSRQIHPIMDRDIYEITPTKTISAMNAQEPYSVHSSYSGAGQFLYGSHDSASYLWAREAGTNDCLQPWGISQDYQDALKLQRYLDVYGLLFRLPAAESSRLADMMNIRYIIAGDSFEKIYWGGAPKEVKVIERPTALPRALVVSNWENIDDPNTALSHMFSNSFDPRRNAVIESLPGIQAPRPNTGGNPSGGTGNTVTSIRHRWNQVEIDTASAQTSSLLVLIETWYPGWKATVDGQSVPIFRANLNFRAVPLGAGAHKVVFSYWPWQFTAGLATSLITFLLLAGLLLFRYWVEIRGAIRSGQARFQGAAKSA